MKAHELIKELTRELEKLPSDSTIRLVFYSEKDNCFFQVEPEKLILIENELYLSDTRTLKKYFRIEEVPTQFQKENEKLIARANKILKGKCLE